MNDFDEAEWTAYVSRPSLEALPDWLTATARERVLEGTINAFDDVEERNRWRAKLRTDPDLRAQLLYAYAIGVAAGASQQAEHAVRETR